MLWPIGKFRGKEITALDGNYLRWAAVTIDFKSPALKEAVRAEIERREGDSKERADRADAPVRHCATCQCAEEEAPF